MHRTPLLIATLLALALAGCASGRSPETVDALVIQNRSGGILEDVRLTIPATGELVSCNYIPRGGECSLGFPVREIRDRNNPLSLSWTQDGRGYRQGLTAELMGSRRTQRPQQALISIGDGGAIRAGMR